MKIFIATIALWSVAAAKPSSVLVPLIRSAAFVPIQSQFHAQDGLGQYAYGYNDGLSRKEETRSFGGLTRGSYSYIDAEGKLQAVDYIADANGFRVAATNLPKAEIPTVAVPLEVPQPVQETPEVIQAKASHLAAVNEAKIRAGQAPSVKIDEANLPKPVKDTPEVEKARAEHLAAKKEVELRNQVYAEIEKPIISAPVVAAVLPKSLANIRFSELPQAFSYGYSLYNNPVPVWNSRFLSTPTVSLI